MEVLKYGRFGNLNETWNVMRDFSHVSRNTNLSTTLKKETTMRYMLLLYGDEKLGEGITPEEWQAIIESHNALTNEAVGRGMNPSGEALQPVATAKTVRYEDTRPTLTTDGPFAETKEQLGGFYIIDCESEEEALEMASRLPMSTGSVEVRPVIEF
jgi:hypothetical protein